MKFLLYLLLGYSVWEIDTGDLRALLNFCNRSGVRLRRIREGETTVRMWVLLADEAKLMDFAARRGCDLRICVRHGVPILWRRYRHRVGMWAGLLLFFAAIYTTASAGNTSVSCLPTRACASARFRPRSTAAAST